MPIGTSDGETFNDRFEHEISDLKSSQLTPSPGLEGTSREIAGHPLFKEDAKPTGFIEDRRVSPAEVDISKHVGQDIQAIGEGYRSKDPQFMTEGVGQFRSPSGAKAYDMYVHQDLSRQEKNPLSQEAGIGDIKNTNPNLFGVLSNPKVHKALDEGTIDRSHEVPYIAGASKDPADFTTHVDKDVPSSVTISGKTFDPAIPLHIHEQVEREVMQSLISKGHSNEKAYEIAHHEYAEPAEDLWYRSHGIDVNEMNKFWNKMDYKTEKDKGDYPPNLYTKPYPHDKVEGIKHEPVGKESPDAEWETNTPISMK